jgi:hypothetical protein
MTMNRVVGGTKWEEKHPHSMTGREVPLPRCQDEADFISNFNLKLESLSRVSDLNERVIEDLLVQVNGHLDFYDDLYWLTLARINELALLCAGNYADLCEYRLVGDLLLNPRRILIHVQGSRQPITKIRHMGLGEQFRHVADSPLGVMHWLKRKTSLEIREKALLPHLYDLLEDSGRLSKRYLDLVSERKTRIASVTGFLASSGFKDGADLHGWMKRADPADRNLMEAMLCRFDLDVFFELGEEIRLLSKDPARKSRYLTRGGDRQESGVKRRESRVGNPLFRASEILSSAVICHPSSVVSKGGEAKSYE